MMFKKYLTRTLTAVLALTACQPTAQRGETPVSDQASARAVVNHFEQNRLGDYWYQGEAEITRYELSQNRYEDVHPGEAVLIFVTEDFLTDEQVKNDRYQNSNSVSVLKTNLIRRFSTGLYDYSIMTSVFTPVNNRDWPATLKVTTGSQDWCGQTFMQLNYRKGAYQMQLNSYFESEGDEEMEVGRAVLEDELLNRIRINPDALPTGEIEVFPGTTVARLKHLTFRPLTAQASLSPYEGMDFEGEALRTYRLIYPELDRTYEIVFENAPPYRIAGWRDIYPSAFDNQPRTTIARRTRTIKSAYWKENGLEDTALRTELGVSR